MKYKKKLVNGLILTSSIIGFIAAINYRIFKKASSFKPLECDNHKYHWIYGDINYTKTGNGKPILLIHNLDTSSSNYEWHKVIPIISSERTVYTIDLIGCGLSEKANITYTNFLYMQLIKDFVKEVICHRTDVAAIGDSISIVMTACANDDTIFDKLIFISPDHISKYCNLVDKKSKLRKQIIDFPVFGTFIYNTVFSKFNLTRNLISNLFNYSHNCRPEDIEQFYLNAHLSGKNSKALFSSKLGNYTNINFSKSIFSINNSIIILMGKNIEQSRKILDEYTALNPSIETKLIPNTKVLIPLENHLAVADTILNF